MAFGLFRKRMPEPGVPAVEPAMPAAVTEAGPAKSDSAKEILELLELELGGMIRQLERAANSVAGGAEATATTLSTIRQRTDKLTGRNSTAQATAATFSQAADKFTQSAYGIGSQVRDAGKLADQASTAAREASLAKDPRIAFRAMIDRNGYQPVHNNIYSHPQRPGDVAWNTGNSRNRRIFNDAAGLAAGRNQRAYLIQTYARDMGNGNMVMMREIDVPISVQGRHWGGFRTAYKL